MHDVGDGLPATGARTEAESAAEVAQPHINSRAVSKAFVTH